MLFFEPGFSARILIRKNGEAAADLSPSFAMVYRRLLRIFVMGFGGHPTSRNIGSTRPAKRDSAKQDGGQREIRTLDTREGIHAFQACALNHSAICPLSPLGQGAGL